MSCHRPGPFPHRLSEATCPLYARLSAESRDDSLTSRDLCRPGAVPPGIPFQVPDPGGCLGQPFRCPREKFVDRVLGRLEETERVHLRAGRCGF